MVVGAYPVLAVSYKDGSKLCMCLIRILNKPSLQDMSRLRWINWINRHFDQLKHYEVLGVKVTSSGRYTLDGRLALASLL